jgi:hypothetical protein
VHELPGEKNKMVLLKPKTAIHLLYRAVVLSGCLFWLSGCAGLSDYACTLQESRAQASDLSTHYRYSAPPEGGGQLPRGTPVKATHYTVAFNVERIEPCTTLSIIKELTLLRGADSDILIKETREFYAEDGTLITSHSEDLTSQLGTSGHYTAVTPLPIPRAAPAGRYLIISRLTMERKGDKRTQLLSAAEASFRIIPRQPGW